MGGERTRPAVSAAPQQWSRVRREKGLDNAKGTIGLVSSKPGRGAKNRKKEKLLASRKKCPDDKTSDLSPLKRVFNQTPIVQLLQLSQISF